MPASTPTSQYESSQPSSRPVDSAKTARSPRSRCPTPASPFPRGMRTRSPPAPTAVPSAHVVSRAGTWRAPACRRRKVSSPAPWLAAGRSRRVLPRDVEVHVERGDRDRYVDVEVVGHPIGEVERADGVDEVGLRLVADLGATARRDRERVRAELAPARALDVEVTERHPDVQQPFAERLPALDVEGRDAVVDAFEGAAPAFQR